MREIALNYIYLSKKHAGGKDQVGLNLLKGFQQIGVAKELCVICYDYSVELLRSISKDIEIISIKTPNQSCELNRMIGNLITNTLKLPKIIKNRNIKVIFNLDSNNGLMKLKAKSIVIPHDIKAIAHRDLPGLHIPFYKYWMYKIMYATDFKHADTIVGISDVDKSEIQEYYPKYKNKVIRIYDPIDIPLCTKFIKKREPNIVAINLQFHHKNIITLIKAFEKIKDQVDENLILVGNVPNRVKYIEDYVIERHLQDRVKFTGFVSDEDRNRLLQNCRLYVTSTLFEGFGMVSIEAIVSGVPTLVSKIPTNYEVTKGLCDYYWPPESVDKLAEAMFKELKTEPNEANIINSALMLFNEYEYKNISKQYYDIFVRMMGNRV